MTDDWKKSVDRRLAELRGEVRQLLAYLIVSFLLLVAGGVALHQSTSAQIRQQAVMLSRIEAKIDAASEARRSDEPAAPAAR